MLPVKVADGGRRVLGLSIRGRLRQREGDDPSRGCAGDEVEDLRQGSLEARLQGVEEHGWDNPPHTTPVDGQDAKEPGFPFLDLGSAMQGHGHS